jgi:hypothetical protein
MAEGTFICCTSVAGDFMGATTVNFFDNAEKLAVKRFVLSKRTQCFSENPIAPVIKLEEDVPQHFLQRGNRVEFV